jgi:hypothetical protein
MILLLLILLLRILLLRILLLRRVLLLVKMAVVIIDPCQIREGLGGGRSEHRDAEVRRMVILLLRATVPSGLEYRG